MNFQLDKIRIVTICIVVSAIVHLLILFPLGKLGNYNFAKPVNPLHAVMVELEGPIHDTGSAKALLGQEPAKAFEKEVDTVEEAKQIKTAGVLVPEAAAAIYAEKAEASTPGDITITGTKPPASKNASPGYAVKPPLRKVDEFLSTVSEKLTYQVNMFGLPVGIADLEAVNENGALRITLHIKSTSVLSTLYPVDDLVETSHIGGNFIITKIRQQEGSFKSDRGFTLFLRDEKVFWQDNLKKLSVWESLPNSEVLDILSCVYFLRNRQLKVGSTELLHVYDSDTYAHLPVEVLRQEQISLPGFRKADTIVVKPLLKTDGIFKRAGEMLIWLTDDDNKVPVKVETKIPLGKVSIELVSAETKQQGETPVVH